jgi:hypothetical protein
MTLRRFFIWANSYLPVISILKAVFKLAWYELHIRNQYLAIGNDRDRNQKLTVFPNHLEDYLKKSKCFLERFHAVSPL